MNNKYNLAIYKWSTKLYCKHKNCQLTNFTFPVSNLIFSSLFRLSTIALTVSAFHAVDPHLHNTGSGEWMIKNFYAWKYRQWRRTRARALKTQLPAQVGQCAGARLQAPEISSNRHSNWISTQNEVGWEGGSLVDNLHTGEKRLSSLKSYFLQFIPVVYYSRILTAE